jgi:hypothetical protein
MVSEKRLNFDMAHLLEHQVITFDFGFTSAL